MPEQAVHPRRHHLRQRQQPDGVTGWCGVEDDLVVLVADERHDLGDPLEHGRFHRARRVPRQVELSVDLGERPGMDQTPHACLDGREVLVRLPVRVDLERPQRGGQRGFFVPDWAPEQVGQRVCRVGRDEQTAPAALGGDEGQCRGDGRLADTALAADEQEPTCQEVVQQMILRTVRRWRLRLPCSAGVSAVSLAAPKPVEGRMFQPLTAVPVVEPLEQQRLELECVVRHRVGHAHQLGEDEEHEEVVLFTPSSGNRTSNG